jgi:hypothetical protein
MPAPVPKTDRTCGDCGRPFIGGPYAKTGPCCRWKHRGRPAKKYVWTPERDQVLRERYDGRVKGRSAELARIVGWPAWVIKKRAATLGLCHPADRKDWTAEEEAFLWEHGGSRLTHWIAKQLRRSETSVVLKFKRMKISRRVRDGYTLRELELCFGVDHHVIERWVREGRLTSAKRGRPATNGHEPEIRRRGTDRPRDAWAVSDTDLLRFVTAHPMAFRLDKVDQVWFMDLITSGGLLRKALADERALEGM